MKVWITKYALTKGIFEIDARITDDYAFGGTVYECYIREGNEWHRTYEAAVHKAEEMRDKKIESLEKKFDKLKKMKF